MEALLATIKKDFDSILGANSVGFFDFVDVTQSLDITSRG